MNQQSDRIKSESVSSLVRNYEYIALVFQGGGALGSYQAGVFEALSEAGIEPNWMSGAAMQYEVTFKKRYTMADLELFGARITVN